MPSLWIIFFLKALQRHTINVPAYSCGDNQVIHLQMDIDNQQLPQHLFIQVLDMGGEGWKQ